MSKAMLRQYEKRFNSPGSKLRVDTAWKKHLRANGILKERYEYSLKPLYGHVLELGAGDGFFAHVIAQQTKVRHVTAVEVQDKALATMRKNLSTTPYANKRITIIKGNIEDFHSNERFDSVHCGHTLEHVMDLEESLESIQRLASDIVVISVPIFGGINRQHVREFTSVDDFRKLVSKYFEEIEWYALPTKEKKTSLIITAKKVKE